MKTKPALIVLSVATLALAIFAFQQSQTIAALEAEIASKTTETAPPSPAIAATEHQAANSEPDVAKPDETSVSEPAAIAETASESDSQRVIRSFETILENPQMNEMMRAGQLGTLEVLYGDLLDDLDLNTEERDHLMDLLLARQMFRVESSMKLMNGQASPEERKLLSDEIKEYDELVKTEIEVFLNDEEDTAAFAYYEQTIGERMTLSGVRSNLAKADMPIDDTTEDRLLDIMAQSKKNHSFKSDLADETNFDMSKERFSDTNIDTFASDMNSVNANILEQAGQLLSAEQLAVLRESLQQMLEMQLSQIKMASKMMAN